MSPVKVNSPRRDISVPVIPTGSPTNSSPSLINVYARPPSSPKSSPVALNRLTPQKIIPLSLRHYPPKNRQPLTKRKNDSSTETESEDDPFKEDLKKFNGKRRKPD